MRIDMMNVNIWVGLLLGLGFYRVQCSTFWATSNSIAEVMKLKVLSKKKKGNKFFDLAPK
jgi:hypothetical protein